MANTIAQYSPLRREGTHVSFKTGLDGQKYPSLVADPIGLGVGDEGLMWYRSDLNLFRYWDGALIVDFQAGVDSLQTSYDGGNIINLAAATPISINDSVAIPLGLLEIGDSLTTPNVLPLRGALFSDAAGNGVVSIGEIDIG